MGQLINRSLQLKELIRAKAEAGLEFAAIELRDIAETELDRPYPPASTSGESPRYRTRQLIDSLRHGLLVGEFTSYVGVHNAEPQYAPNKHGGGIHWVYLINAGRLGLEDYALSNLDRIRQAFKNGVESVR